MQHEIATPSVGDLGSLEGTRALWEAFLRLRAGTVNFTAPSLMFGIGWKSLESWAANRKPDAIETFGVLVRPILFPCGAVLLGLHMNGAPYWGTEEDRRFWEIMDPEYPFVHENIADIDIPILKFPRGVKFLQTLCCDTPATKGHAIHCHEKDGVVYANVVCPRRGHVVTLSMDQSRQMFREDHIPLPTFSRSEEAHVRRFVRSVAQLVAQ